MDIASNKRTTNFKSLDTIYDAQFLMRYHTVPIQGLRQTVGAHSYAVAILIDQLWDNVPKQLVLYCEKHADSNTQMKIIMNTGVQYLFSNFSDLKDFDPVKEVLRNRNLSN